MKKIHLLLCLVILLFSTVKHHAQSGVNTKTPNQKSLLHISERKDGSNTVDKKGILIPRLTEIERDEISPSASENSLLIYNTTEECYNYWHNQEAEWKSLCGKLGKAVFTIECTTIEVLGSYIQGRELSTSNYIKLKVNVTKPGEYFISATTDNGYNFTASGTFLSIGIYTVNLQGQGLPITIQEDSVLLNSNGEDITCTPEIKINVLSPAGTYTFTCKSVNVNGVYKVGVPLNSTNTVTVPVVVTEIGSYSVLTNVVGGISFSGSGTFTSIGNQNITLYGSGVPDSPENKNLQMTSDSKGTGSKTCDFNVVVTIPVKKLLTIGSSPNGYGYNFSGNAASNKLITTKSNFGELINSVVHYEGFNTVNVIDGTNSPSASQLTNWLLGPEPVDILVLGYSWTMSVAEADIISEYILKNGVVLAFSESNSGNQRLFQNLFNDINISSSSVNAAGALYKLPVLNDEILNGPFGDIRGKYWGEDASSSTRTVGLPLNDIDIYSYDADYSQATPNSTGAITAFKHKNFNLIWVGDGGFNSNDGGTSSTICPFKLDANNFPIPKPNYGRGTVARQQSVYNSIFTANAISWAIRKAEFNGINTP